MSLIDRPASEIRWVLFCAIATVIVCSMPYYSGLTSSPTGASFFGFLYNIDDGAVYTSWIRQIADGSLTYQNLYAGQVRTAEQFNVLFLLMGFATRVADTSPQLIYHVFRMAIGVGLIAAIWRFSVLFIDDYEPRLMAVILLCFSSGIGWLFPHAGAPTGPVDMWQPEAITFLSLYLNPLFLCGQLLMVGAFYWLTILKRGGRMINAVYAGLCLLFLANIHPYDMVIFACVWFLYLIAIWVVKGAFPTRAVVGSLIAGATSVPAIVHMYLVYSSDAIFRERVATQIHSPPVWSFFAGYGLVFVAAIYGVYLLITRIPRLQKVVAADNMRLPDSLLLVVWSFIGFIVPYIPVAQQRKLIMGVHIPLCLIAAFGLHFILVRKREFFAKVALLVFFVLVSISNLKFVARDVGLLTKNETVTTFAPYISLPVERALTYLRNEADANDVVLAPPDVAVLIPAVAGTRVYYGHWSETPDYKTRLAEWKSFYDSVEIGKPLFAPIAKSRADYLFHYGIENQNLSQTPFEKKYLEEVFSDGVVYIYRVKRPG